MSAIFKFGPFEFYPEERLINTSGVSTELSRRASDLLRFLIDHAGETIPNRDLLAQVWSEGEVDNGSLRVRIAEIKKVLGDHPSEARFIQNIHGKGYRFIADVLRLDRGSGRLKAPATDMANRTLPPRIVKLVGRDDVVTRLHKIVLERQFVTLVGPGGIGKTTVGIAVGHSILERSLDLVYFVDFSTLDDPQLIWSEVALVLGIEVHSQNWLVAIISFLREKQVLLILDGCEHLVDEVSGLIAEILSGAPQTFLLITSRESLRVEGECIYSLSPLDFPLDHMNVTSQEILEYSAAELLIDRVIENQNDFELSDVDAPFAAEICRRVDGIALALELAAGRVAAHGLQGTAKLLQDHIAILVNEHPTGLARHQTLIATLDWSYNLLSGSEQQLICRLSVFVGSFTLDAAKAIAAYSDAEIPNVIDNIGNLISKSLVSTDISGPSSLYRLLDTTRFYASEKLNESGEAQLCFKRHASYFTRLLQRINTKAAPSYKEHRLIEYRSILDNTRAALRWSFDSEVGQELRIGLTSAAGPLFLDLAQLSECCEWSERAIQLIAQNRSNAHVEMEIQTSLIIALMFTQKSAESLRRAFARATELAEQTGNELYQIIFIDTLLIYRLQNADFKSGKELALRRAAIESNLSRPLEMLPTNWILSVVELYAGNLRSGRDHSLLALQDVPASPIAHVRLATRAYQIVPMWALAANLWLQGRSDQAIIAGCQTACNRDPQSASKKDPSIMAGWPCPGSEQEGPARPRSAFQRRWRSGRVGGACLPIWASRG